MKEKIINFIKNIKKNKVAESADKPVVKIAKAPKSEYTDNLTWINLKTLVFKNMFQFM